MFQAQGNVIMMLFDVFYTGKSITMSCARGESTTFGIRGDKHSPNLSNRRTPFLFDLRLIQNHEAGL